MVLYNLFRSLLFLLPAEKAHSFTVLLLKGTLKLPFSKYIFKRLFCVESPLLVRNVFGIDFPNPVGLAAGFDKNASCYREMEYCGFGFVEIGTVTPVAQPGNDQPRLFRLKKDEAIINRMGFNNNGMHAAVENLKKKSPNSKLIIGGNIGKNKTTLNEDATSDYIASFKVLFDHVDYFVVNVSSPNTKDLRALQEKEPLKKLLGALQEVNATFPVQKPLLLKIAPDLSGKPLEKRSTEVIRYIHDKSKGAFPIIGVGGIHSADDAIEKLNAGASLLQLYTGFIYEGPFLNKRINKAILTKTINEQ